MTNFTSVSGWSNGSVSMSANSIVEPVRLDDLALGHKLVERALALGARNASCTDEAPGPGPRVVLRRLEDGVAHVVGLVVFGDDLGVAGLPRVLALVEAERVPLLLVVAHGEAVAWGADATAEDAVLVLHGVD